MIGGFMGKFEDEQFEKNTFKGPGTPGIGVIPADAPQNLKLNWKVDELAGVTIYNSRGVTWVKVRKPRRVLLGKTFQAIPGKTKKRLAMPAGFKFIVEKTCTGINYRFYRCRDLDNTNTNYYLSYYDIRRYYQEIPKCATCNDLGFVDCYEAQQDGASWQEDCPNCTPKAKP